MSEATVLLEIPVRVYAALQERARTKHTDPISILKDFLDMSQPPPKKSLAEILLEGPTLSDEELAEYDRITGMDERMETVRVLASQYNAVHGRSSPTTAQREGRMAMRPRRRTTQQPPLATHHSYPPSQSAATPKLGRIAMRPYPLFWRGQ